MLCALLLTITCHTMKEKDGLGLLIRARGFSLYHKVEIQPCASIAEAVSYHSIEVQSLGEMGLYKITFMEEKKK